MSSVRSTARSARSGANRPRTSPTRGRRRGVVDVWIAARAGLRTVLEHVTLADLASGKLPAKIEKMVADPEARHRR